MRRSSVVLVALLVGLALTVPAGAHLSYQVSGGQAPYVVIMADDPVVAYQGDIPGLPATAPGPGQKVDPDSPAVRNYQRHLDQQRGNVQQKAGVEESQVLTTYDFALAGFAALLTADEADRLRAQKDVLAVFEDELHQIHTDTSGDFLGLTAGGGAYDAGLDGEGVVVGVIDTGIWPEHPSFADDGSYDDPGIDVPCEFGNTDHNPEDVPFECNNKLLGARDMRTLYNALIGPELYDSARDFDGHGSHTASTAAGNAGVAAEIFGVPRGVISGIAPRAHVIAYKGCGDLGCFGGDLADAIDQAVADGVEVINYSIGSTSPAVDGPDDIAFLFATASGGVHVATSNGNSGPGASTVGSPASTPWVMSVGASHHSRMFQGSVTLGDGTTFTGASVTLGIDEETELVDAADLRNELCDPAVRFRPAPTGKIVLCKGAVGRAGKSNAVLQQGGVGMVLYNDFANQTLPSDNHFVPTVHVTNADGLAIKAYIDEVIAAPGSAVPTATIAGGEAVERPVDSFMAYFSSRGPVGSPVGGDIIKPDVTAPGVQILAANSPAVGFDAAGELFQAIQGTSMSSPHGAGVLALVDQAHPTWTPAMVKSAVMTTARQDVFKEDQTTAADPFDMGAGHIDPGVPATGKNSMFNPGVVYNTGFNDYLGYLCDVAPQVFANPAATCASLANAGVPTTAENLNYPSIGAEEVPGVLTVQRRLTNVSGSSILVAATVEEPEGFDVTVSPASLRIPPGQTRAFEVTFVNQDAPIGQFRFGSLTWEGNGYVARSPIAVAASKIGVPDEVTGTGVSGSVSFDVSFGYSGEYDATAHGLAPDVGVTGSVGMDEDQTFDPNDPEGTTAHEIQLSGTAVWRLTLDSSDLDPANPDIDIDLYLYKDGEEVASSTNPGTEEEILLTLPEDGTYTLFVHGWQTLDLEVGYNLHTWNVSSEADAGSLAITAEPEDAVQGTVGEVTAEWSGLDAGTEYLGAVGHNDEDGLFGLTLVVVDT